MIRCYELRVSSCHWVVEPIPGGLHNRYEKVKDTGSSPVIITKFLFTLTLSGHSLASDIDIKENSQ